MSLVTEVALGNAIQLKFYASVGMEYPMPPLGVFCGIWSFLLCVWVVSYEHIFIPLFFFRESKSALSHACCVWISSRSLPHCRLAGLPWWRVAPPRISSDYGTHIRTLQLSSLIDDSLFPILVLSSFLLLSTKEKMVPFVGKLQSLFTCSRTD